MPGGADNSATNFKSGPTNYHRLHVANLFNVGGLAGAGTSIDQAGNGVGNALCAECHFRPHSTAFPTGGQAANQHLIAFAPNVQPFAANAAPVFTATANGGSCTLVCHGQQHDGLSYSG